MAKKIHKGIALAGLLLCLQALPVYADDDTAENSASEVPAMPGESESANAAPWPPILSFDIGPSVIDTGQSQSVTLPNGAISTYSPNHLQKDRVLIGALFGVRWKFAKNLELESGFAYNQPTPFVIKGTSTQTDIPSPFGYKFNVVPRQLLAQIKILYNNGKKYHPYVLLGLGESFNSAYEYRSSQPSNTLAAPTYENQNNTAFSYMAGFGIDFDITPAMRLGAGYRFADFGNANLGLGVQNGNEFSPQKVLQNHLYTNALVAQFTYEFL